jgi:hypothetical protein
VSDRPITKPLFEAGIQCAKRLYLDFHFPERAPARTEERQELAEIGARLVELASQAFQQGTSLIDEPIDRAAEKTLELTSSGKAGVVFHAAFRGGGSEVRVDIALSSASGELDIFEVKAGTTVKPRHLLDVALQIHTIEAAGGKVRSASILHLDPKYKHDGSSNYPVQQLFKNVDVTKRARNHLDKIQAHIDGFRILLEDEGTLELPTGTWCTNPLPCDHLPACREEAPEYPLVDLPQLKPDLESKLHENGIEDISQIDENNAGLTLQQRRVVASVTHDKLIVEPVLAEELRDIDYPIAFVHVHWHLQVLPKFANSRPWSKIPFLWSMQTLSEDPQSEQHGFVADSPDDPREPSLKSLAEALRNTGTLVIYGRGLDERLRSMLDDLPALKPDLRSLLQVPLLELGNLLQHAIYHPDFQGKYDLATMCRTILQEDAGTDALANDDEVGRAYRRMIKPRTRQKTREALAADLAAYSRRQTELMVKLYLHLRDG